MIPIGGDIEPHNEEKVETSRTYKINFGTRRVIGMTEGIDAVKQSVYKILNAERFVHLIYGNWYGFQGNHLIGQSEAVLRVELERRIREALMQDDRISDITDVQIIVQGDEALVDFTVVSTYGDFRMELIRDV
ncbi:DUF2634 domain-containing protein [Paenibacillus guangzhouensis]|uniref:DUF2634 domain-containing protein n=1 Tax=Paenibacillus guangzhouensis TaxID=1473112 RepID=UPI001D122694|nr:DUF2634 domain-containing protein [Paenibacillus guangzhouensis]